MYVARGTCEFCHRTAELESYVTRLFITVAYLPVIPLWQKQIINRCPICAKHREMSVAEWERVRLETLDAATARWAQNRNDPDAGLDLIAVLESIHKREEADQLAAALLNRFGGMQQIQMFLGGWYSRTRRAHLANECFQRAFELDPNDPVIRRAFAASLIEFDELDNARELLQGLESGQPGFDADVFLRLASAYQRHGWYRQAHEVLQSLLAGFPDIAGDISFRDLLKKSAKGLGINATPLPKLPVNWNRRLVACAAAIGLIVVIVGAVAHNMHVESHCRLHVLNGLARPIGVAIDNGPPIIVPPRRHVEVTVAEGTHSARLTQPAWNLPAMEFTIPNAGWFQRFSDDPFYAIDPSRSAQLMWETTTFAKELVVRPVWHYQWHLGEPFVSYPKIDFLFAEFPDSVALEGAEVHNGGIRTRISTVGEFTASQAILSALAQPDGRPTDAVTFCESHLRDDPRDRSLLTLYSSLTFRQAPNREREFLATGLTIRPVLTEWHRHYQEVCDRQLTQEQLIEEYDGYLRVEPEDSMLLYLRGRVDPDPDLADEFYGRAGVADPRNPYPWIARGNRLWMKGDFAIARRAIEEAAQLDPENHQIQQQFVDLRFALGDFAPLVEKFRAESGLHKNDVESLYRLSEALVAADQVAEATTAVGSFLDRDRAANGVESEGALFASLYLKYLTGQFEELLHQAGKSSQSEPVQNFRAQAFLELDRLDDLERSGMSLGLETHAAELLLAIAWERHGETARAEKARASAVEYLSGGTRRERYAAEMLRKAPAIDLADALNLEFEPTIKAIILVALAEASGKHKTSLLEMARKFNYRRNFPYHFLKRTIDAMLAEPARN